MNMFSNRTNPSSKELERRKAELQNRKEERKRKWKDPSEEMKYVCHGGKVQCKYCSSPIAPISVTAETVMLQDKPWATVGDNNGKVNFGFAGSCMHPKWNGKNPPCNSVIGLGKWKNYSETIIGSHNALLAKSTIPCMVSGEDVKIVHSGQKATLNSKDKIAVSRIGVLTSLDDGSYNDGSNRINKKGFIYGKTYTLEATHFVNGIPKDEDIKWKAEYIYTNGKIANIVKENTNQKWCKTGRKVTFSIEDLNMPGGTLVFYAYVNDPQQEAKIDIWVHYRYRYLDFKTVSNELNTRLSKPWAIDQSGTSLCGMACLFYILVKNAPQDYERLVTELHHKGSAVYNGFTIEPYETAKDIMYNMIPESDKYPISVDINGKEVARMPLVDWLTLATLRSHESTRRLIPVTSSYPPDTTLREVVTLYSGERENSNMDRLAAVNWPNMMEHLCKDFLGFSNVDSIGLSTFLLQQKKRPIGGRIYDFLFNTDLEHLQDMEKAYQEGAQIIMMIDMQMLEDRTSYSYADLFTTSHWIVYEGGLKFLDKKGNKVNDIDEAEKVSFHFFTWGRNPQKGFLNVLSLPYISIACFKSTFYGYIICK